MDEQFLSRIFVVMLHKIFSQNNNLKAARDELDVRH